MLKRFENLAHETDTAETDVVGEGRVVFAASTEVDRNPLEVLGYELPREDDILIVELPRRAVATLLVLTYCINGT